VTCSESDMQFCNLHIVPTFDKFSSLETEFIHLIHIWKAFTDVSLAAPHMSAPHHPSFPKPANGSPSRSSKPPSHTPQGFDNPTPRRAPKEGRSFPKRPAFRMSGVRFRSPISARPSTGDGLIPVKIQEKQGRQLCGCVLLRHNCSFRYPKSAYLGKKR